MRSRLFHALSKTPWESMEAGRKIATLLQPGTPLLLKGGLGAGKTTLLKGVINALTGTPLEAISSPTFTYLHLYDQLCHFDLYRLQDLVAFEAMGFLPYLDAPWITCIEWSERIPEVEGWSLELELLDEKSRLITLYSL